MTGKYIECDRCGARLGHEEVTRGERGLPTIGGGKELRVRARLRGWLCIDLLNQDVCPACAALEPPAQPVELGRPR